ncbi:MAG: uroporphyrinogen-III synthase, partial [Rhodospirillaceae bacterium]
TDRINDIISIRRTGADVAGDSVEARIARAELLLAGRDVAGAVAELDGVSGAAGDLLAPWMARALGHLDARAALSEIEAQAIARLRAEGGS